MQRFLRGDSAACGVRALSYAKRRVVQREVSRIMAQRVKDELVEQLGNIMEESFGTGAPREQAFLPEDLVMFEDIFGRDDNGDDGQVVLISMLLGRSPCRCIGGPQVAPSARLGFSSSDTGWGGEQNRRVKRSGCGQRVGGPRQVAPAPTAPTAAAPSSAAASIHAGSRDAASPLPGLELHLRARDDPDEEANDDGVNNEQAAPLGYGTQEPLPAGAGEADDDELSANNLPLSDLGLDAMLPKGGVWRSLATMRGTINGHCARIAKPLYFNV